MTDAEVPPPWDGRVGEGGDVSELVPASGNGMRFEGGVSDFYIPTADGLPRESKLSIISGQQHRTAPMIPTSR